MAGWLELTLISICYVPYVWSWTMAAYVAGVRNTVGLFFPCHNNLSVFSYLTLVCMYMLGLKRLLVGGNKDSLLTAALLLNACTQKQTYFSLKATHLYFPSVYITLIQFAKYSLFIVKSDCWYHLPRAFTMTEICTSNFSITKEYLEKLYYRFWPMQLTTFKVCEQVWMLVENIGYENTSDLECGKRMPVWLDEEVKE